MPSNVNTSSISKSKPRHPPSGASVSPSLNNSNSRPISNSHNNSKSGPKTVSESTPNNNSNSKAKRQTQFKRQPYSNSDSEQILKPNTNQSQFNSNPISNIQSQDQCNSNAISIHEINATSKKVSLPNVYLHTNYTSKVLCFLIDTGASVSIAKLTSFAKAPTLSNEKIKLKGLSDNDSYCESLGTFQISFDCETDTGVASFNHVFHAISDNVKLNYDGILGNDFLSRLNADVRYSNNCLHIQGHLIPINFSQLTYVVPARSEAVIECSISNDSAELHDTKEALVLDHSISEGVFVANSIVSIKPNKKINISILNTTNSEIKIKDYKVTLTQICHIPDAISSPCESMHPVSFGHSERINRVLDSIRTSHLNDEERKILMDCCSKYTDIFHLEGEQLTYTNVTKHTINTGDAQPIHVKSYRFPECHKDEVERQIKSLLDQKIIRPSNSPWSAPVWVVPKKMDASGKRKWRLVIDYRKLNDVTVSDVYPLPLISDILDQLGHSKYFTTLDLASGFHEVLMDPADAPKTGFTVSTNNSAAGHYEFTRMPFGLKNAPATFQRLMNTVLSGLQGLHCFIYLDDCIVYSHDLDSHMHKLELVFSKFREANLKLQPDKCEFLRREVAYLGHTITDKGVFPNPDKVKAVTEFPAPKNPKDIKSFLGLVGYYRRFIENFSKITKPLTSLLKKDAEFHWNQEQQNAFSTLKSKLTSAPLLQYPDFSKTFILTTDASNYAVGAILSQGVVGKDKPIAYASRTLNKAEGNYSTIEKELLAILFGVKTFRPYLYGHKFQIVTDHRPLVWLFNVKDPSSKLIRWRLKLEEYDYEIIYKQGKLNSNADALSRFPVHVTNQFPNPSSIIAEANDSITSVGDTHQPDAPPPPQTSTVDTHHPDAPPPPPQTADPQPPPSPSVSETYEQFLKINRQPSVSYDTNIQEHRDSLLKAKCKLIVYPTSIDLDDCVPYCHDIIESSNSQPDIRTIERELNTFYSTSNEKHLFTHLFLRVNHYDEMTYKDIFNLLRDYRDMIKFWYMEENEFAISDFNDPFSKLSFPKIYNMLAFLFHGTGIKVNIYHDSISYPTPDEVKQILKEHHDSPSAGHPGTTRMIDRIKSMYWWKSMRQDIEDYVKNCRSCQINKPLRQTNRAPMIITSTATRPIEKVFLDIVGPLPETYEFKYKFILTLQDDLTKYSQAYPLQTCSADETAKKFVHFISHVGIPRMIVTDQGTNFCSEVFKQLDRLFGIKHIFASPYHPQTCGALERSHSTLKEYLRPFVNENPHTWDLYLNTAMFSYNTNVHSTTNFSPFELLFGFKPYIPKSIDTLENNTYTDYIRVLNHRLYYSRQKALQNIQLSKERSKKQYDSRTKPVTYNINDMVYVRCHHKQNKALSPVWKGPYKIVKINGNHTVTLLINRRHVRHHYDEIKLAADQTTS